MIPFAVLQFLETAKAMVPGVARTALSRAWDESRGLGGSQENALEIRIQGEPRTRPESKRARADQSPLHSRLELRIRRHGALVPSAEAALV